MTLAVAMFPIVIGATGCFDVHGVDQGPWVIDDFEDGDLIPADRNFGAWDCYTFNPSNHDCNKSVDSGYQGGLSLTVEFTIIDPAEPGPQNGGAGVHTGTAATPEDLSRFSQMVFAAKLVSGVPALPSDTQVAVMLGCSTAKLEGQTTSEDAHVVQPFTVTSDWNAIAPLSMANFVTPLFPLTPITGGPAACLERVDSIGFEVGPNLLDGQSTNGQLNVDEIRFQ